MSSAPCKTWRNALSVVFLTCSCAGSASDGGVRSSSPPPGTATATTADAGPARVLHVDGNMTPTQCAVLRSGEARCWGDNRYGQLGLGDTSLRFGAAPLPGVSDILRTVHGGKFGCALRRGGGVHCWGTQKNVGKGRLTPSPTPDLSDAVALAAGWHHACAAKRDGSVLCWGDNGGGESGERKAWTGGPSVVAGITGATALAAGLGFTCALSAGRLHCWGSLIADDQLATQPTLLEGDDYTAIAAHANRLCALRASGGVRCWGELVWNAPPGRASARGVDIAGITGAAAIAVGWAHGCALTADRSVWCWGHITSGEQRSVSANTQPRRIDALQGATSIGAGHFQTCAAVDDTVKCWGEVRMHQFTEGSSIYPGAPRPVVGVSDAIDVRTSEKTAHVLHASGRISWWGNDAFSPQPIEGVDDVSVLGKSGERLWGLRRSGTLWGVSGNDGPSTVGSPPVDLHIESDFRCWLDAKGDVNCFRTTKSALGARTEAGGVRVPLPRSIRDIDGSESSMCALTEQGEVLCWGNLCGKVVPEPQKVNGLTGASGLDVRAQGSGCAVRQGRAVCWSQCDGKLEEMPWGEVASVSDDCFVRANREVACQQHGQMWNTRIRGASRISAAKTFVCAVIDGGRVVCAGDGVRGTLGTGEPSPGPFAVEGI